MNMISRQLALLEGVAAGLLFGTAAIFIRLLADVNVFSIAFWRLIIASAVLAFTMLVAKKKPDRSLVRQNFKHFLFLGVLLGTHFVLFVSAVKDTTLLNATALVNTTPVFSIVISAFLYRVKPQNLALAGVALSLIGVSFIAYGNSLRGEVSGLIGDIEATLAAVAEGFYLNVGREKRRQLPLLPSMLFIYVSAAVTVAAATTLTQKTLVASYNLETLVPLMALGILPTAVAHTLYYSSLSDLKSFETAAMALLEPLGATLLGIAVFAEMPKPIFVLGAALTLVGVYAVVAVKPLEEKKQGYSANSRFSLMTNASSFPAITRKSLSSALCRNFRRRTRR